MGGLIISIFHMTSRDHVLKGPCEVMDGSLFMCFMVGKSPPCQNW